MIILIFPRISPALSASASERCHRERRRAIRGADGDVRPLPLGRGSTWRPADRCGQADQCAYVRPSEGRGVGRGGRRVRERAWVVTQLGGRWGGLGRCAPPRRGDADPRRNTMPTSSAAHVDVWRQFPGLQTLENCRHGVFLLASAGERRLHSQFSKHFH